MATISKYCKAYSLASLREFPGWEEKREGEVSHENELEKDRYVYIHDNLVVTRDIFVDEGIIFDDVTPEWKEFCSGPLNFAVPA